MLLSAAAGTFLAATPWLRAYQVVRAPLLLALAAVLPVVISVVASRVARASVLVSYAVSADRSGELAGGQQRFRFRRHMGRPGPRARAVAHRDPAPERGQLVAGRPDGADLAVQRHFRRAPGAPFPSVGCWARRCPSAYFAFAFVATTSGPAGATMPEGAALLGVLVVCALARQGLIEAEAAQAGTGRSATGPEPARRRSSLRRATAGAVMAAVLVVALACRGRRASRRWPPSRPPSAVRRSCFLAWSSTPWTLWPRCADPTPGARPGPVRRPGAKGLERLRTAGRPGRVRRRHVELFRPRSGRPEAGYPRPAPWSPVSRRPNSWSSATRSKRPSGFPSCPPWTAPSKWRAWLSMPTAAQGCWPPRPPSRRPTALSPWYPRARSGSSPPPAAWPSGPRCPEGARRLTPPCPSGRPPTSPPPCASPLASRAGRRRPR